MRSSVPRVLRRAAALLILMILPVYLATPAVAWGQANGSTTAVTSNGVRCGDEVISFDTLNLPTEGANAARVKELAKLYAYAKQAWEACGFDKTHPRRELPGCKFVKDWFDARKGADKAWENRHYWVRTRLRALDGQMIPQAMRVLAHQACYDVSEKGIKIPSDANPPPACVALLTAEIAPKGVNLCEDDAPAEPKKKGVNPAPSLLGRLLRGMDAGANVTEYKNAKQACDQGRCCDKPKPQCDKEQQKAKAKTYERAVTLAKLRLFYAESPGACPSVADAPKTMNDEIERRVEDVVFDRPTITPLPAADEPKDPGPLSPSAAEAQKREHEGKVAAYRMLQAIHAEHVSLRRNAGWDKQEPLKGCKDASYYVTPTGMVIENEVLSEDDPGPKEKQDSKGNPDPKGGKHAKGSQKTDGRKPSICIDMSSFALDRPFDVVITAYPEYSPLSGSQSKSIQSRVPSMTVKAWPGERTEIDLDRLLREQGFATVRITVRGYPRGISLRALAQRGVASTRFDASFETTDLRMLARKVAEARVPLATEVAETAALDALATAVGKDADVQKAIKDMTDPVAAAAAETDKTKQPAKLKTAAEAVNAARNALEKFEKSYAEASGNAGKPTVAAAVVAAMGQLPEAFQDTSKASLDAIQKAQAKIKEHQATLETRAQQQRGTQKNASDLRDDLDRRLARLCRISKELLPVVDEDVLIARASPEGAPRGVYVIDYDYEAGFQRTPPRDLQDNDRVYVRVRRVRPNEAVAIAVNDKGVVQHAVSLVGYVPKDSPAPAAPSTDPVAQGGSLRSGINDLRPDDVDIQASSTQILALPGFQGARRYDFVVCALTDRGGACPPGDTVGKSRVIARNTLVVHAQRRLGVRAGVGVMGAVGDVRSLVDVPDKTYKLVRKDKLTLDAAVPLLLTYYFMPRDAVDMPRGFSMGIGAGPDLVATFQAKPRLYAGLSLDCWGLGLTLGGLVEQRVTLNAPVGSEITTNAPEVKRWYPGAFLALTTDFDIFEAVIKNYVVSTPAPAIGNGGN